MRTGILVFWDDLHRGRLQRLGCRSCQLLVFPDSPLSPSRGATADDWRRAMEWFESQDIEVSAVGSYTNNIAPDAHEREGALSHLRALFGLAPLLRCSVVGTFAGRNPALSIADNIPMFRDVFSGLVSEAADAGITIAIENCPMFRGYPMIGTNIAYTPESWRLMFDAVPSGALALEYDPSHLICLGIDSVRVIQEFGPRIAHVHAKDAEVLAGNVYEYGILDYRSVRHRMPGFGECDWPQVIGALREIGYTGNLDIEGAHDPEFHGEREEEGLRLGLEHLNRALAEAESGGPQA